MSFINGEISAVNRKYDIDRAYLVVEMGVEANLLQAYQSNLSSAQNLVDEECQAIGLDAYFLREQQRQEASMKIQQNISDNQQATLEALLEQLNTSSCPDNSYYSDGNCFCNKDYMVSKDTCIKKDIIPPSGTLNITPTSINLGDIVRVTVIGRDNKELSSIQFKYDTKLWQTHLCSSGDTFCSYTWEVSDLTIGNHTFTGYVLDKAWNNSYTNPQSINIVVNQKIVNKPIEEQEIIIKSLNDKPVIELITEEENQEETQQSTIKKEDKDQSEIGESKEVEEKPISQFLASIVTAIKGFFIQLFR